MIDLKPFCGEDPYRPYLQKPFRHGDFTYATNGHIMVRVPPIDGVDVLPGAPAKWNVQAPLDIAHDGAMFFAPPEGAVGAWPAFDPVPCFECKGVAAGPDDDEACGNCSGIGFHYPMKSVSVGGVAFHARYIRMILDLPRGVLARRCNALSGGEVLAFCFFNGIGAVMALTSPYADHLGDIEAMA